ncbi:hypothetical protein FQN57_005348 [Myotisia sp. PD_48]|nr:hypothetical protein FQN57_005348 [Myotisia sp. PD_48]
METCVYEDSPLADYLEGEGEGDQDWAPQVDVEWARHDSVDDSTTGAFAPQGPSKFQDRIRNKIPEPLQLNHSHRRAALSKFHDAFSAVITARISKPDNERFLEQFGYIIVASQLLNEPSAPSYTTITGLLSHSPQTETPSTSTATIFDLRGAIVTAVASFSVVCLLHWARSIHKIGWNVKRVVAISFLFVAVAVAFHAFAKRQWLRYLRRQAVDVAGTFVGNSHTLDSAASAAIVLIQEVELVSRGYRVSYPLPPVSRMEEQSHVKRCLKLRRALSICLAEMLEKYLDAKRTLRPLVDNANLEKYHDVYDFSAEELQDPDTTVLDKTLDDKTSLRSLRNSFNKLFALRKSTLCCLLAMQADGSDSDILRWNAAIEAMQALSMKSAECITKLRDILNEQDREIIASSPLSKPHPSKDRYRAQLRRLNSLSQGIRGLHAKMQLIREESDACLENSSDDIDLSSTLITQYESIGADLRGILQEWEAGKSSMLANMENSERLSMSRPSSMLRSPSSPTFSLGGVTAVEGSPADALRALNGERLSLSSPDSNMDDDEVFEAIALPRKRSSMTREERIARMKEDRARQATVRERSDANTHMLRELETVIKLRPRGKAGSRVTSVVEAIRELVHECNFDCSDSGIALQAMDSSHVALVAMLLKAEAFSPFRCDRNIALGVNLVSLTKVLRAAQDGDVLTLKAYDTPDVVNLLFESPDKDRVSEYDLKLMDIDQEHLAIPETEYGATVEMPSGDFRRICSDLAQLSESIFVEASKEGVRFSCQGEIGNGSVTVRQSTNVEKPEQNVTITLTEPVALTFSVKYLLNFCKSTALSSTVRLSLSQEVPLLVEYVLDGSGYLRFFLAPKINDDD